MTSQSSFSLCSPTYAAVAIRSRGAMARTGHAVSHVRLIAIVARTRRRHPESDRHRTARGPETDFV